MPLYDEETDWHEIYRPILRGESYKAQEKGVKALEQRSNDELDETVVRRGRVVLLYGILTPADVAELKRRRAKWAKRMTTD